MEVMILSKINLFYRVVLLLIADLAHLMMFSIINCNPESK
jgi:hypothetical protein